LLGLQAALCIDDVLEFNARERWLTADLTGRHLHVLLAHRGQDFIHIHVARCDLARIQPQAHGIVAGTEYPHIPHAGQARQHVADLDQGVISKIQRVVAAVGGLQEHHHGQVGRALLSHQPKLPHHLG